MTSGAHVRVEGVRKSYGGVVALADLDLELRPGITGLLGPNGAGKTTLIRILATLLAPSAGEVGVNGWQASSVRDRVEIRRRLGYLPQDLGLYPRFTVFEFVDYLAMLKELEDPGERHRRVRAALEAVELEDLARRKIRTLSGGMRRRVGIAQAIVADPELLLLDEPTTGLDPEQRMRFRQLIAGIVLAANSLLAAAAQQQVGRGGPPAGWLLPMTAAALLAVVVASRWTPAVGAAAGMGGWLLVLAGWRVSDQPAAWLTGLGAQTAYAVVTAVLLVLLVRRIAREGWVLPGPGEPA
jgi:ABC-type Na+ transport system ATPase subunit NatA